MDAITRFGSFKSPSGSGALSPARILLLTRSNVERLLARDDEIIVFDSSGTALRDAAAAAAGDFRRALGQQQGVHSSFNA